MRMYTMFTESHRRLLYDYFLPSLIPGEYLLTVEQFPQIGDGTFGTPGFVETLRFTFDVLLGAVYANYGDVFVFSDCDVQFFGLTKNTLKEAVADCDVAIQADRNGSLCTGFFACKANDTMEMVFKKCAEAMRTGCLEDGTPLPHKRLGDQAAINAYKHLFKWTLLDANQFWSPRQSWKPGSELNVPGNMLMHHANWTVGVDNKAAMLRQVSVRGRQREPARAGETIMKGASDE